MTVMATEAPVRLPCCWTGLLAPLDTRSGDRRVIAATEELRTRDLPLPLSWQPASADGHSGKVIVGRIDDAWVEDGGLYGRGTFDLDGEHGREAARLVMTGMLRGVSVDLDDTVAEMADGDDSEPVMIATSWRLMGATLVIDPAFNEARISPLDDDTERQAEAEEVDIADLIAEEGEGEAELQEEDDDCRPGETEEECRARKERRRRGRYAEDETHSFVVTGATDLPIAPTDRAWDGPAAAGRVFDSCSNADGDIDAECASRAFLFREGDGSTRAQYKLPFADLIDGELTIVPRGVSAATGGRGVDATTGVPPADKARIKSKICGIYRRIRQADEDWPECPFEREASIQAAAVTRLARPHVFSRSDFSEPKLTQRTPITVTEFGGIFGHMEAPTCHRGFEDVCIMPPHGCDYDAHFHLGEVVLDDGDRMTVGALTLGGGHADPRAGVRAATEHYDNADRIVAIIRVGEHTLIDGTRATWVAGRVAPWITNDQLTKLMITPVSGDWRTIAGRLQLIAVHAVVSPGFNVPRTVVASVDGLRADTVIMPADSAPVRVMIASMVRAELALARDLEDRAKAARARMTSVRADRARDTIEKG